MSEHCLVENAPTTPTGEQVGSTDLFGVPLPVETGARRLAVGDGKQEIYTPDDLARLIVGHFKPSGRI